MDYLTVAFFRFDHGLKTFFPSSDVLLNACIPTIHVPFGTFLNVAVTVPSLRFSFLRLPYWYGRVSPFSFLEDVPSTTS